MKATYKRYLAAAFATVGLMSLGVSQILPSDYYGQGQDAVGPTQTPITQSTVGNDQITPDASQPSAKPTVNDTNTASSGDTTPTTVISTPTPATDLGVTAAGAPPTLDTSGAPQITLNQTQVDFSGAQPGIINGQLMVPVRDVCEQLGATVDWSAADKQVVLILPGQQSVTLDTNQDWLSMINPDMTTRPLRFDSANPDSNHLVLNSNEVILIGDRAYMPFDQLAAAINGSGNWDTSSNTAAISTDSNDQVPSPDTAPPLGSGTPLNDNSGTSPSPDVTPDVQPDNGD